MDKEYWQIPRFIYENQACPEDVVTTKTGALTNWQHIRRAYENHKWYMLVFKPYNKPYEQDPEWFKHKTVDKISKWCKSKGPAYFVTKEILDCQKIHGNAVVVSKINLIDKYHGRTAYNKYKIHVSELPALGDRMRALSYITKENKKRPYKLYSDYYFTK